MFKKKPYVKPLSLLKSSERRKIADQIIDDFAILIPLQPDADDKVAAIAARTTLRSALLPDNVQSAKFTTTAGPDLKQVAGTVYVGSREGEEQRILWVKLGQVIIPTVYTLWHNPGIIPLLHTYDPVIKKIQGGADLMIPGLANGPPFPLRAKHGTIVAIASTQRPAVPLAVGTCLVNISELNQVQGVKGHAVETIHWYGDELWAWSTSGKAGGQPPELNEWDGFYPEIESLAQRTSNPEVPVLGDEWDLDGGVSHQGTEEDMNNPALRGSAIEPTSCNTENQPQAKAIPVKEMDKVFRNAFLYGVRHYMTTNKDVPNYGLSFPLSQSFVMSTLVQPFLPAFTPAQASQFQIKKTSYKTIRKFIMVLDKERIIKSKAQKDEAVILDIDFNDRAIESFIPYLLPEKTTQTGVIAGRSEVASTRAGLSSHSDPSIGQKLQKINLYRPREKHFPIFAGTKVDPRNVLSAADIRSIVTTYIESEELVSTTNKRLVKLNPALGCLFDKSSPQDKAIAASGNITRDALLERILAQCSPFYAITPVGDEPKPKAGHAPKIHIILETRSGNKTVTKVNSVEVYGITPQLLADELKKVCAGSTSVDKMAGSSPKNPVMEVMVQGPQKEAVLKALERRGVLRGWVEVVDRTKGKGKKKG